MNRAARELGFGGNTERLLAHPEAIEYLEKFRAEMREKTKYDVEASMAEAAEAMQFARDTENANALVKAIEHRAKLHGLLIEKHDVRSLGQFSIQIEGITPVGILPPQALVEIVPSLPAAVDAPNLILESELKPISAKPKLASIFDEDEGIW